MAKKTQAKKTKRPQIAGNASQNVPVSKQTAGGVTGAVLGAAVAGPFGAIAGGLTGAMVGDASAKGKKPMKKAVEAIGTEIREAHITDKLKAIGQRVTAKIKSFRKGKKTKVAATKKKSAASSSAGKKSKPGKKKAKTATKKAASTPKKKRAKKKR